MIRYSKFFMIWILAFISYWGYGQDAQKILIQMDELMGAPQDRVATIEMTLTNRNEVEKVSEAILKQIGSEYRIYRYTKPEKKAGIATLTLPDGKMWLYMPSFNKVIKITLLSKSQAFTGTDFSYEDMSGIPYNVRYSATLENATRADEYLLSLSPKIDKTEYSKILIAIDKTHGFPKQMAFFDKQEALIKKAVYTYVKKGKYWYADEVLMTDLRKEHSTNIKIKEIVFDTGLKTEDFTVEALKSQE